MVRRRILLAGVWIHALAGGCGYIRPCEVGELDPPVFAAVWGFGELEYGEHAFDGVVTRVGLGVPAASGSPFELGVRAGSDPWWIEVRSDAGETRILAVATSGSAAPAVDYAVSLELFVGNNVLGVPEGTIALRSRPDGKIVAWVGQALDKRQLHEVPSSIVFRTGAPYCDFQEACGSLVAAWSWGAGIDGTNESGGGRCGRSAEVGGYVVHGGRSFDYANGVCLDGAPSGDRVWLFTFGLSPVAP
jgi:hypothetical protein